MTMMTAKRKRRRVIDPARARAAVLGGMDADISTDNRRDKIPDEIREPKKGEQRDPAA